MSAPWYRMHANLADTKVVWRCAQALGVSPATAAGHLAFFWGKVSQLASGGDVSAVPDQLLEQWAGWTGKRGRFAQFVREQHTTDGRVNDYDEFNGALEQRREKDRVRKAQQRSRDTSGGSHADVPQDVAVTSGGYETKRDDTRRTEELPTYLPTSRESERGRDDDGGATVPDVRPAGPGPTAAVRLTVAANQGVEAAIGEQPRPFHAGHGAAVQLATFVVAEGIDLELAVRSVFTQAKRYAERARARPDTLAYFRKGVEQDWQVELTRRAAATTPAPEPLDAPPSRAPRGAAADENPFTALKRQRAAGARA